MVRTFLFTVVFVVVIGLVHALVFLPALLDTIVPNNEFITPYTPSRQVKLLKESEKRGECHLSCKNGSFPQDRMGYCTGMLAIN